MQFTGPFWHVKFREIVHGDHVHCEACDRTIAERIHYTADSTAWVSIREREAIAPIRWTWLCEPCFDQLRIPQNLAAALPSEFPTLHRRGPKQATESQQAADFPAVQSTVPWTVEHLIAIAKFHHVELTAAAAQHLAISLHPSFFRIGGFEIMARMHSLLLQNQQEHDDDLNALFDFQTKHILYPFNVLSVKDFVRLEPAADSTANARCECCCSPLLRDREASSQTCYASLQAIGFPGSTVEYQRPLWLCDPCFDEWKHELNWQVVPGPLPAVRVSPSIQSHSAEPDIEKIGVVEFSFRDFQSVANRHQFDLPHAKLRELFTGNARKIASQAFNAQLFELQDHLKQSCRPT